MALCCRLVGARGETVKPGWMWAVNLGSACSQGLHWKDPAGHCLSE